MGNDYVTVCIPSKLENQTFIVELIESLNNQTVLPKELLIVASGRKLDELRKSSIQINNQVTTSFKLRFIFSEKKGLSFARNLGIKNCKNDIIIFGDDDDIWLPDRVYEIKNALTKYHPCLVRHLHKDLRNGAIYDCPKRYSLSPSLFLIGTGNLLGGGSNFAGSLSCFDSIKFNESLNYCEDWEFWIRALLSKIKIISIKKPLVIYRNHENRMTNSYFKNYIYETKVRLFFISDIFLLLLGLILGFLKSTLRFIILDLLKNLLKLKR